MGRVATYNLASPTKRLKFKPRAKAYFCTLRPRLALGYIRRNGAATGRWIVQREVDRTESGPIRKIHSIGLADDYTAADGKEYLSYDQAIRSATGEDAAPRDPLTVRQAIGRYLDHLTASKGEGAAADARSKLNKHVLREDAEGKRLEGKAGLGEMEVRRLTLTQLREWLNGLVHRDKSDDDAERRSKDTANRILATFKAALNHAFEDEANNLQSDKAWRALKGFKNVGGRREDHFTESEVLTLINKAREFDRCFADLAEAVFHTGARPPGELAILEPRHLDVKRSQIRIPDGKTGERVTTLTAEGVAFFKRLAADKKPRDVLLPRADGERWGKSQQHRPMKAALEAAKLPASASMYTIRHTYISRAIERGMPLTLIAENVGTSVTMIERNYGKFIAQTRRDLIQRTAPVLRLVQKGRAAA